MFDNNNIKEFFGKFKKKIPAATAAGIILTH